MPTSSPVKEQARLVGTVAHALRTPLAAIRGFAETLAAEDVPPATRRRFADAVRRHTLRLSNMVDSLLTLSRLENNGPAHAERIQFRPYASFLLDSLAPLAKSRKVRLALKAPKAACLFVDRSLLGLALQGLLENALKYSHGGGRVELAWAFDGGQAVVSVSDSGIGIPKDQQERIFGGFHRLSQAKAMDEGGCGLGLSIVKCAVESWGGRIWVESRPGKGSTFRFTAPLP